MLPEIVNEYGREVVDMGRGISKWMADDEKESPAAVTSPKKSPPKSPLAASGFPVGQPKVFHFHPIAFVEQMRRSGDFCKSMKTIFPYNMVRNFHHQNLIFKKERL